MDKQTVDFYDDNAAETAARYESEESPYAALFPHIFSNGDRVLDIGCGSGRDMALMQRLEINAYGIEASKEMLARAARQHPELTGKFSFGSLPESIPQLDAGATSMQFDGIILSAVLMHIPDSDLFDSALRIRELLTEWGTLLISVSTQRNDTKNDAADASNRDARGRLMILRPVSRLQLLFENLGFELTAKWHSSDTLHRLGFEWTTLQFTLNHGNKSNSIDRIESIINRDAKVATYKLALLRAFCDVSLHQCGMARWETNGTVSVSIEVLADKWIEYYWPLLDSPDFIPQIGGETPDSAKPISFRHAPNELISTYDKGGGLTAFAVERDTGSITGASRSACKKVISKMKTAIQKPVFYAGAGDSDSKPFVYDTAAKRVCMDGSLWREFSLLGHFIRDRIIMRWAEETERMSKYNLFIPVLVGILLKAPDPGRNVSAVKELYASVRPLECVWSGRSIGKLGEFDVDHAIPFSLWRDNSLWNLLPAHPKINNQKRQKLPTLNMLSKRKDIIINYWELVNQAYERRFQHDAVKITGEGVPVTVIAGNWRNWQIPLFKGFIEAVETTAVKRGTERWSL